MVSVITPAFNAAAHLEDTIASCCSQSYADFELLLVDDGSTDDTAAIAARCAAADTRIRVFRVSNGGTAAARNVAIAASRGEFLALLDSDDIWMPTYLETQLDTLSQHPAVDVLTCNAFNLGGHADGLTFWPSAAAIVPITLLDMIVREDAIHIFSVFRRTVINRIGAFDSHFDGNEDYHFWLRAAAAGYRFAADFTPRGWYRRRPGSASADQRRMLAGIVRVFAGIRQECSLDAGEAAAIDVQVRRFTKELRVAEARACLAAGDSAGAVECLRRIPSADRGRALSMLLTLAGGWPPFLSGGYRTKRVLRRLRPRPPIG